MTGGPLYWFRKNQKILLVVFGVLLMIVFTVGGVLDSFFSGQNQGGSPVRKVASTSFGDFTNQDMDDFAEANRRAAEFTFELYRLSKDPAKAKAVPISPLNASTTEARDRDILSRLAFAEFAKENGLYVGEEILNDYFNMLCNNELSNVNKTVEQFSRELQRGSLSSVKAHLKIELLARCGQQMISAGVNPQFSPQGFLVGVSSTPLEIWEGNRRLREKFKIEYMTIDVPSVDSISAEPTDEELQKLYQEGMDRAPNISIGPGFKNPRRATVSYFAVNRDDFLKAEKEKITEQEIQTKYQEWVENEDFRVIESSGSGTTGGGGFQPKNGGDNSNGKSGEQKSADSDSAPKLNSPSSEGTKKGTPEKDANEKSPAKDIQKKAPVKKAPEKKSAPQSNEQKPKEPKKVSALDPAEQPGFQLVSLIQEKDAQPQGDGKSKQTNSDPKKTQPAKGPGKQESTPPKTEQEQPKKETPKQAGGQPKKGAPNSVPPKSVQDDQEKDKPKIKPLDDKIRDLIKTELARPIATEAVKKAFEEVKTVVADFLNDYDYYNENSDEKDYLDVPDFAELAKNNGLLFKQFKEVDYKTLSNIDFGKANVIPTGARQQAGSVAAEIFFTTFQSSSNFEINMTRESDGFEYMYWVIDKKFRKKLSFEEAKPSIVEYFKKQKAIKAAEAEAQKIADEVSGANKTLSAVYGDRVKSSREFGWMEIDEQMEKMAEANPRIVQQMPQFFMPKMGQIVPETPDDAEPEENIDHRVMSKIFRLAKNEIGYSVDSDREKIFIFQVKERTQVNPVQKNNFFTPSKFGSAQAQSQLDQGADLTNILSAMDLLEKYSVKWFGESENN